MSAAERLWRPCSADQSRKARSGQRPAQVGRAGGAELASEGGEVVHPQAGEGASGEVGTDSPEEPSIPGAGHGPVAGRGEQAGGGLVPGYRQRHDERRLRLVIAAAAAVGGGASPTLAGMRR
jgi:hypothetical protein